MTVLFVSGENFWNTSKFSREMKEKPSWLTRLITDVPAPTQKEAQRDEQRHLLLKHQRGSSFYKYLFEKLFPTDEDILISEMDAGTGDLVALLAAARVEAASAPGAPPAPWSKWKWQGCIPTQCPARRKCVTNIIDEWSSAILALTPSDEFDASSRLASIESTLPVFTDTLDEYQLPFPEPQGEPIHSEIWSHPDGPLDESQTPRCRDTQDSTRSSGRIRQAALQIQYEVMVVPVGEGQNALVPTRNVKKGETVFVSDAPWCETKPEMLLGEVVWREDFTRASLGRISTRRWQKASKDEELWHSVCAPFARPICQPVREASVLLPPDPQANLFVLRERSHAFN